MLRSDQVNILLMSLMFLQVWLYIKGYTKSSAIVLSAMILLKVFPVVLIVYYLVKRQLR